MIVEQPQEVQELPEYQRLIEVGNERGTLAFGEIVEALAEQQSKPIVCPMLNQKTGTCRVYMYRPTACRTYGFYVQRDKGLYCKDIEAQVANGGLDDVVWGNHNAIDHRLKHTGETRELTAWFSLGI